MTQVIYSYTFKDQEGRQASYGYFGSTPEAHTLTDVHGDWEALGAVLEALTDCEIVKGQITLRFDRNAAWKASPVAGANISKAGLFEFILANTIYRQSFLVPSMNALSLDAAKKIDITDTGVKAFINGVVSGWGTGNAVVGMGKFGQDVTGFLGCRTTDRTHRKQSTAKTWVDGSSYVP
jgi:hypothetical protein